MAQKFDAQLVTRSAAGPAGRLEVDLVDNRGCCQTLSIGPDAARALLDALGPFGPPTEAGRSLLTKLPKTFAVGHGRHEPVVLVRFEDDPAYALSMDQATELSEALLEEAQSICEPRFALKQ